MSPPPVSLDERLRILGLCEQGMPWSRIASLVGRHRRTVGAIATSAGHTRCTGPGRRPVTEAERLTGILVQTVGVRRTAALTGRPHHTIADLAQRLGVRSPLPSGWPRRQSQQEIV